MGKGGVCRTKKGEKSAPASRRPTNDQGRTGGGKKAATLRGWVQEVNTTTCIAHVGRKHVSQGRQKAGKRKCAAVDAK